MTPTPPPVAEFASANRATAAAVMITSSAVLPLYLTGALAVQLQSALRFDTVGTGTAVSVFFASAAVVSPLAGRLVDRIGWRRAGRLSAGLSATGLLSISVLVTSWPTLVAAMAFAGFGHAMATPAANLALATEVAPRRRGLAFGVKHMAIPIAGLIAGISVPLIALTVGWRWAYALPLVVPAIALLTVTSAGAPVWRIGMTGRLPTARGRIPAMPAMLALAVVGGLGAGAVGALSAFFVESAVRGGTTEGLAGVWYAAGSAVGLGVRPAVGWLSDRRPGSSLPGTALLLAFGAVGFAMLTVRSAPLLLLATVISFGAGWGWPGLYHHAVVDRNPGAAAAATGVAVVGLSLGGAFGPSLFGLVVHHTSFDTAWLGTSVVVLTAAALALTTEARLRAGLPRPTFETSH